MASDWASPVGQCISAIEFGKSVFKYSYVDRNLFWVVREKVGVVAFINPNQYGPVVRSDVYGDKNEIVV